MLTCSKCGVENNDNSKFCNNCGKSLMIDNITSPEEKTFPQKDKSKKIKFVLSIIILILVAFSIKPLIGKYIDYVVDKNIKSGDYIAAYEKSKDDEKDSIYNENIVAFLSKSIKENLKDPDSFELTGSWYCENLHAEDHPEGPDGPYMVLEIRARNGFGGYAVCYYLYKYDAVTDRYNYINNFQNLDWQADTDKITKYGYMYTDKEQEDFLEQCNQKLHILNTMNGQEFLNELSLNNINNLSQKGLLEKVEKIHK